MKRILLTVGAAAVAGLFLAGSVEARPAARHSSGRSSHSFGYGQGHRVSQGYGYGYRYHPRTDYRNYHRDYGVRFSGGVFYRGAGHYHWSRYSYSPAWRTTFYFCPSTRAWYYWYAAGDRYYPVSYLSTAVPVPVGPPTSPGDLPPAAPPGEGPDLPPVPPGHGR
jgi:hypothetical protein